MSSGSAEVRAKIREWLVALGELGVRELPAARTVKTPSAGRPGEAGAEGRLTRGGGEGPGQIVRLAAGSAANRAILEAGLPPDAPPVQDGLFSDRFVLPAGADPAEALAVLRDREIGDCQRCRLCGGRTHIVFGSGNPRARLMFVGEGPGADEDARGEPFVGRAGQKLTEMIEKGMGIPRPEVYIANIIKCRPPENRDPADDEIAACEGFLFRQIDIIRPRVIVALGKFAAQTLLRSKMPISALRGRFWKYRDTLLMPTFHPAYLLRQYTPENRRTVWEDLKKVAEVLSSG